VFAAGGRSPPVAAVDLDDPVAAPAQKARQPGSIAAGAFDPERCPTELLGPGCKRGTADAVSADRQLAGSAAELIQGDSDVQLLVGVDANDEPPLRHRRSDAFH
jgi:hypothetical protein